MKVRGLCPVRTRLMLVTGMLPLLGQNKTALCTVEGNTAKFLTTKTQLASPLLPAINEGM